jgi:hypothetical protein
VAKLDTQTIPPLLLDQYKRALAPARTIAHPGGGGGTLTDYAAEKYPDQLEPPNVPSADQLDERQHFKSCISCYNLSPQNEREGYFRLAQVEGLNYFQYYLHQNIPRSILGQGCDDWRRPLTSHFDRYPVVPLAYLNLRFSSLEDVTLHYDATLDPCAKYGALPPPFTTPFALAQYYQYEWDPARWGLYWYQLLDPAVRTRYSSEYVVPACGEWSTRSIVIYRDSIDPGEAVAWKFYLNAVDSYNAEHWTIPPLP